MESVLKEFFDDYQAGGFDEFYLSIGLTLEFTVDDVMMIEQFLKTKGKELSLYHGGILGFYLGEIIIHNSEFAIWRPLNKPQAITDIQVQIGQKDNKLMINPFHCIRSFIDDETKSIIDWYAMVIRQGPGILH
ncbi:hypothetical protein [Bacillus taeanensis]|uniref:Uncharacterized protein n=1 Tax=Bacillus taeanensis TaxID=273032 RepID=A0A366XR75_9BACI|nr:hypothetical protein [Bacillus taeanensis]RBW68028.1 hypothetical protein DS031_19005 [Bacillus taeanensis]